MFMSLNNKIAYYIVIYRKRMKLKPNKILNKISLAANCRFNTEI